MEESTETTEEMDFAFLVGVWEIIDCGLETAKGDGEGVIGTIFELTADGEVFWKLPENYIKIPVFNSEAYETVARGPFLTTLIRFGSYKGHVIEFRIEKFSIEAETMTIHEGLLYLSCKKLTGNFPQENLSALAYTLLPAFEESYFTDLTITASDNTEFEVHKSILKMLAPDIDWLATPNPLTGLPRRIISAIVHYMYSYSLPKNLTLDSAEELIDISLNIPGLEHLAELCNTFIQNVTLAREMGSLISEVHVLGVQATNYFVVGDGMQTVREPPQICSAVRNAMRDIAAGVSKMVVFCDTYNKRKREFSQKGAHELIRFTKSRIPYFVGQVATFMQIVKATFTSLSPADRQELASYLIPDMPYIFDTVITLLLRAQEFFETLLVSLGPEDNTKYRLKMQNFNEHMERINHKKEVSKVRFILHRIECLIHHLKKKRDRFRNLNYDSKIRSLVRNLEHLVDRLPFLFLRIEELTDELQQKCEWIEGQFFFKMTTARVGEFLKLLLQNKEALQSLLSLLCDVVQREDFTQAVISLGILDLPAAHNFFDLGFDLDDNLSVGVDSFNISQFIWEPPPPSENNLCRSALQMLLDDVDTDMIFQINPTDILCDEDGDCSDDTGDFTYYRGDSVYGQSQALVKVDAKVKEDASSTDRGSDSEATASTEAESTCPNNTKPKGTSSILEAAGVTATETKTGYGVPTKKPTDGVTEKSRGTEDEVPAGKSDDATQPLMGKDQISPDKQIDRAKHGGRKAENEIPAVHPERYREKGNSDEEEIGGVRRRTRKPESEIPFVHSERYGEKGNSDEEEIGGVRRRTRKPERQIPTVHSERYGEKGNSDEEEIGGVRRRTRKSESEIPAVQRDSAVRPRRYEDYGNTSQEEIGGVRRRTRRSELPPYLTHGQMRPRRYEDYGNTSQEEIGGVRRRTRRSELPPYLTHGQMRPRRYEDYGNTSQEEIGGVRRRTTGPEYPPLLPDNFRLLRGYRQEESSDEEEIGGVRRRTTGPEYPPLLPDNFRLLRGYRQEESSDEEEIGGVRRRTRRPEHEIPTIRTDSPIRMNRDNENVSSTVHQIGGARRRASGEEKEEGAVWAIAKGVARIEIGEGAASASADNIASFIERDKEQQGAACASADSIASFIERDKEQQQGAACAIAGVPTIGRGEEGEAACAIASVPTIGRGEEGEAACAIAGVPTIGRGEERGAACAFGEGGSEGIAGGKAAEKQKKDEIMTFRAHRVIIATRCPLFKRALLSGMVEDITRTIEIRNISPKLFPIFLNYLYTGIINYPSLSARQLIEMFLVADCYELYSLKEGCERALKECIDENSVLLFYHISDKYIAPVLKDACKRYIKENPNICLNNELYNEMSSNLRCEVYELIAWGRNRLLFNDDPDQDDSEGQAGACALDNDDDDDDDTGDSDPGTAQVSPHIDTSNRTCWSKAVAVGRNGVRDLNIIAPQPVNYRPNMFMDSVAGERELIVWINLPSWEEPAVDIEDSVPSTDSIRFRWCLDQLRDIVGPSVPRSTLVQIVQAADCDLNRALDYYYLSDVERPRMRDHRSD